MTQHWYKELKANTVLQWQPCLLHAAYALWNWNANMGIAFNIQFYCQSVSCFATQMQGLCNSDARATLSKQMCTLQLCGWILLLIMPCSQ